MNISIQQSHEERCEDQGHVWESCCTILLQIYQKCKYCGAKK